MPALVRKPCLSCAAFTDGTVLMSYLSMVSIFPEILGQLVILWFQLYDSFNKLLFCKQSSFILLLE